MTGVKSKELPTLPPPASLPWPPIEPPPAGARFPDPRQLGDEWVVGVTKSLSPGMVLQAYREGIFPWPTSRSALIPWASPEPRTGFPLQNAGAWPRSVKRDLKRAEAAWQVTFDQAYSEVMRACADRPGEGTWITPVLYRTYCELHALGWGHSVEVWRPEPGGGRTLIGGLYGRTSWRRLTVELLFVPEKLRGQGMGTKLLAQAEEEAKKRGCIGVWLETFSPDAHRFYLRQGFKTFGEIADYPPGNTRYFVTKDFA